MTSNHLLLYRLAELMLQHEQHLLPVDLLFDDEQIGDFVKSIQIDSPYQQLLLEGVLTESVNAEKLYVSYTVEGYFHFVLGEVLESKFTNFAPNDIFEFLNSNKLIGLNEGFKQFLIRRVDKNDLDILLWFIDFGVNLTNLAIDPLAHAFLLSSSSGESPSSNSISQSLFATPTENDVKLVLAIIDKLDRLQKQTVLNKILSDVLSFIEPDTPQKARLFIHSIKYLNSTDKLTRLEHLSSLNFVQNDLETVKFYQTIGSEWNALGNYSNSIDSYKKALEVIDKGNAIDIEITAEINNNLGIALQHAGQLDESLKCYSKAVETYSTHFGSNYIAISTIYNNLGLVHQDKGNYDEAHKYYNLALNSDEKNYGTHHPNTATTYNNIGSLNNRQANYSEAKKYYDKALKIFLTVFGNYHEWTATLYNNIALVDLNLKCFDDAHQNYHKALNILEQLFGTNHPWYAATISNIGGVYQESGDFDKAIVYFEKGLNFKLESFGKDHPSVGISYNNIAKCYFDLQKHDLAKLNYNKALVIFTQALGEQHPHTNLVRKKLENLNSK
jgi:tetratricopeptide (TPR) repeat protein